MNSRWLGYLREKQYREKLPHGNFWYDEKVVFLIAYIDTHQKSSRHSKIYVSVDNICSNAEERFCLEILSWGKRSSNKNKSPFNDLIICCRVYFLSLLSFTYESAETKNTLEKFITNAEAYLEPVKYLHLLWNFLA